MTNSELKTNPLVTIIGAGPVGVALAGKLTRSGVPIAALYGRTFEQAEEAAGDAGVVGASCEVSALAQQADVIIIAVADHRVPEVAAEYLKKGLIGSHHVVLHTCGAWAAHEVLSCLVGHVNAVGTLHPLASISSRKGAFSRLNGASFGIEGDVEAVAMAERLVSLMGCKPLRLLTEQMPLYHAGAAIGSNLIVAVMDLARKAFEAAGVPPEEVVPALVPLLRSTVDNLEQQGLPDALTGPVARGDVLTIERHLGALDRSVPDVASLYRLLGHEVLSVALRKLPSFEAKVANKLRALFETKAKKPAHSS